MLKGLKKQKNKITQGKITQGTPCRLKECFMEIPAFNTTVYTLIRRRVLRRLIRVYTVCNIHF